ncbi:MAG TPA: hypothetical protein VM513_03395 [Kofleriaceae bacterium]|jgi:hypothetical protein|nr:hypothetical protein [Kofleriaceae bacterium]
MSVEKLSVSMDAELAKLVRSAAAEEGMSVSTWLSEAARVRARQRELREALAAFDAEHGALDPEEAARLVSAARDRSIVVGARRRTRRR